MQHIGIVACSAEGAALCYREICHQSFRRLGAHRHPRITMDAVPLIEWMPAFDAGDDEAIAEVMLRSCTTVAAAGADFAICPDNSAHRAMPFLRHRSPIPWLHIGEVVASEARRRGHTRVGILGTRFTMSGPVYTNCLGALGIEAVVPEPADQHTVDRIIADELLDGVITVESRNAYVSVIDRLAAQGCDGVALACTEIPLLVSPGDSPLPTLDSTRLLAAAAVSRAIGNPTH